MWSPVVRKLLFTRRGPGSVVSSPVTPIRSEGPIGAKAKSLATAPRSPPPPPPDQRNSNDETSEERLDF